MKKNVKLGRRIEALRKTLGIKSQVKFARRLNVASPTVNRWETGQIAPPSQVLLKLGMLAPDDKTMWWFWRKAGLDQQTVLSAAAKLLKERSASLTKAEKRQIVRIAPHQQSAQANGGPKLLLPARFIPSPGSTTYLVLEDQSAQAGFATGDVVVLDERYKDPKDLRPLLGQVVLFESAPTASLPRGRVLMGWLKVVKVTRGRRISSEAWFRPIVEPEFPPFYYLLGATSGTPRGAPRKEAVVNIRLAEGCRILGRVICWFRPPRGTQK